MRSWICPLEEEHDANGHAQYGRGVISWISPLGKEHEVMDMLLTWGGHDYHP